jgi:Flp pilus assembly protein protease CpaA
MADAPDEAGLPPSLKLLKALVIVLTLTMIGGVITVVALIVTRMPQAFRPLPVLPETIAWPEGAKAQAVTFGTGWIAVVTTDNRILVFGDDGALLQSVALPAP